MGAFTTFQNTLPDPNNYIAYDGSSTSGHAGRATGPGFASIKFRSQAPVQVSRTNSGRVITRGIAGHKWDIDITYNPMTRDDFEPIFSFLLQKNGRLNPFFIQLPNQYTSRNAAFNTHLGSNVIRNAGTLAAGVSVMKQDNHEDSPLTTGPQPGDMFTITDPDDSLHTKAYRVTRVTTNDDYLTGSQPAAAERYVYFTPNLQRATADNSTIVYTNPKIRVILKSDVQEYSLGTNNLYTFGLKLEEAQA